MSDTATARMLGVVAAVAVATPKSSALCQDRADVLRSGSGAGAVICDGVGSLDGSGKVAEKGVQHVHACVAEHGLEVGILGAADSAAVALADAVDGATTLLAGGYDSNGWCYYTMVGNGSIIQVEATETDIDRTVLRAAALALPHVTLLGGRPALRSFLPAPQGSSLEVTAGLQLPGRRGPRALILCSDGIATDEDCRIGTVSDGSTWQLVPAGLVLVLRRLQEQWHALLSTPDPRPLLEDMLDATLDELLDAGALDDDASLAVVLYRPTPDAP